MTAASENPRRPPKKWMRDCVRGASRSARNPGAVCGALWYHKMSAAERRAALRREGKDDEAMLENADPAGTLLAIAIGAVVVTAIVWAFKKDAEPTTPSRAACPSFAELTAFEQAKGYHLWYVENQAVTTWTAAKSEFTSDPMARAYSNSDCGFYRFENGAWLLDGKTNAELVAFRGPSPATVGRAQPVLTQHPIRALLPIRGST